MTGSRIIHLDVNDGFGKSCFSIYAVRPTKLEGVRKKKLFSAMRFCEDVTVENHTTWDGFTYVQLADLEKCTDKPYVKVEWTIVEGCDCDLCTGKTNEFSHEVWATHNTNYDRISNAGDYTKQQWRDALEKRGL